MVEIHEAMRLLVSSNRPGRCGHRHLSAAATTAGTDRVNGWIVLLPNIRKPARSTYSIRLKAGSPGRTTENKGESALPIVECSFDWFAGRREPLPPALLRRPVAVP